MRRILLTLGAAALACGLSGSAAMAQATIPDITSKMTGVSGELAKVKTGEPVQTQQKEIVRDLDEMIAELEKQLEAGNGGRKKNNPNRGMADSMISQGTGGSGPLGKPGESQKDWAKLSSRERDRILQSMSEGFPPEYRTVLERYYRRLAEEKTVAPGSTAKPAEPKTEKKS